MDDALEISELTVVAHSDQYFIVENPSLKEADSKK